MSHNYTQLSFEHRYQLEALLQTGRTQKEIAQQIGMHPSTIYWNFRRNSAQRGPRADCYIFRHAQRTTAKRHAHTAKVLKFIDPIKQVTVKWLQVDKRSPQLICVLGKETSLYQISYECLFQWI
jgi:IS30 family transposase